MYLGTDAGMYLGASPGDEPGRKVPLCTFLVRSIMCAYAGTYVCATVCTSPRDVSRQVIPNRQASPLASRNVPVCRHFGIQRNMGSGSLLSPTEKRALDPLQRKRQERAGAIPAPTEKGGVFSRERAPYGVRGCNLAATKRRVPLPCRAAHHPRGIPARASNLSRMASASRCISPASSIHE